MTGYSKVSKGVNYHLHHKGHLYWFSKKASGSVALPSNYTVKTNTRTGLPFVKKK